MRGRVGRAHLVGDHGVRLERAEAVGETHRDQKLFAARGRQFRRYMLAVSRRAAAKVDRDVENAAGEHVHQLRLRDRRKLEMQAAHRADGPRLGQIVLTEIDRDAGRGERRAVPGFGKEATRIHEAARNQEFRIGNRRRFDPHDAPERWGLLCGRIIVSLAAPDKQQRASGIVPATRQP